MSSISKLEEELLHGFYLDRSLKKIIATLSSVKIKLDAHAPTLSVVEYEIDIDTFSNESISFHSKKEEFFIDEIRTLQRDTVEEDDWEFLEMDIDALREQLPAICTKLVAGIEQYLQKTYHESFFLPYALLVDFLEDEKEEEFSFPDPVLKWTRAWKRLVKIKRNYLLFIGFTAEQLDMLQQATFSHLNETYSMHPKMGEIKEIGFELTTDQDVYAFSFFQKDAGFETKFYRSPSLEFELWEGTLHPLVIGETLHECFSISDEHCDQLNDLLKEFVFSNIDIYYDGLDEFETVKFEAVQQQAMNRIGDSIVSVFERDGDMIYVLTDGTRLIEYK